MSMPDSVRSRDLDTAHRYGSGLVAPVFMASSCADGDRVALSPSAAQRLHMPAADLAPLAKPQPRSIPRTGEGTPDAADRDAARTSRSSVSDAAYSTRLPLLIPQNLRLLRDRQAWFPRSIIAFALSIRLVIAPSEKIVLPFQLSRLGLERPHIDRGVTCVPPPSEKLRSAASSCDFHAVI